MFLQVCSLFLMLLIYVAHTQRVSFRGLARLFVQDMIFQVPQLIVEITKIFTLEAGDLILTGTPEGVGPIQVDPQLSEGFFFREIFEPHHFAGMFAQNLIWREREREREPTILIFGICVFSKMFMFLVLPGEIGLIMDHPFQLKFFSIWAWQS